MAAIAVEASNSTQQHPASPTDLRHITSNTNLVSPTREQRLSNRTSQHLRTHRLGSRSPNSIPSSPTSVHSSSSAIFERDIEPISPSPPAVSHDPHRIPRGKNSEQLDQSVPSVLDSAAEILASSASDEDGLDSISIVAPVSLESSQSGFTSPISRLSSRSPSPTGNRRSVLLNLPSPSPSLTLPLPLTQLPPIPSSSASASSPIRPTVQTTPPNLNANANLVAQETPTVSTPTSAYYSVHSQDSSPTTATHSEHPLHSLPTASTTTVTTSNGGLSPISTNNIHSLSSSISTTATATSAITASSSIGSNGNANPHNLSHPPSPKNAAKRLSFISYTDLLSSTPASTLPLASLTQLAQISDPPPHLPSVLGFPQAQHANGVNGTGNGVNAHGHTYTHAESLRDPTTGMTDDVGGEWEREGLGRGLEERLESLLVVSGKA